MEEILHQLRLVVYPIINGVSYIPGGCLGFLPSTVLFPIGYFSLYRTPTQRRCSLPGFPRNFRSFKTTSNAPSWIIFDWWICGFVRVFCFFLKEFSWWKNAGTFEAKIWEKQKLYIYTFWDIILLKIRERSPWIWMLGKIEYFPIQNGPFSGDIWMFGRKSLPFFVELSNHVSA